SPNMPVRPATDPPNKEAPTRTPKAVVATKVKPATAERDLETKINIPNAPRVTPADILDQVVFEGVGGGVLDCPDLSRLCAEAREDGVYLVGFEPNQEVIVMMYQYIEEGYRFVYYTQWKSTVGSNGTLWIEISNLNFWAHYVVLDASNNRLLVASAPLTGEYIDYYSNRYSPCTQAGYKSRLKLGDKVRVAYVNGANLRLRSGPDHRSLDNVIGGIPEGTVLYIDSGPECAGGWIWWWVYYQRQYGWVAEGDGTDWLLEPWK
ncbi:MAG: hypothetical protein WCC12_19240, partial [Anaerolineales bacterium]